MSDHVANYGDLLGVGIVGEDKIFRVVDAMMSVEVSSARISVILRGVGGYERTTTYTQGGESLQDGIPQCRL